MSCRWPNQDNGKDHHKGQAAYATIAYQKPTSHFASLSTNPTVDTISVQRWYR
jgi:hypothetical protein